MPHFRAFSAFYLHKILQVVKMTTGNISQEKCGASPRGKGRGADFGEAAGIFCGRGRNFVNEHKSLLHTGQRDFVIAHGFERAAEHTNCIRCLCDLVVAARALHRGKDPADAGGLFFWRNLFVAERDGVGHGAGL